MALVDQDEVRFFSGQSHPQLAAGIADYLGIALDKTFYSRFSNDNLVVQLGASVRGRVVYIVQSLISPVSERLLELFMMLDIARGAAAREIHAVVPYFSYARSDKKDAPRISITARLVADLLQTAGATHFMTMTLHSPQVHGFFSVPTDPLTSRPLFVRYFQDLDLNPEKSIVVAPDIGHAKPAARFADRLGLSVAAGEKTRISDTQVVIDKSIKRQVGGFTNAIIYDDEISTGGTMLELCRILVESGLNEISLVCTHGLFTGNAMDKLVSIPEIVRIVTTDTVPLPNPECYPKLSVLSVAPLFGEAISRNFNRQSIGDLFAFSDE